MKAELVPVDGGKSIPITKDITVIGRREYCDVQLDDPSLSKRHCVVIKTDGLLMVRDLASTNGTRVKGQLVRWAALLPNDRVAFGKVKFRVFLGPADSKPMIEPSLPQAQPGGLAVDEAPPQPQAAPDPAGTSPAALPEPGPLVGDRPPLNLDDSQWFDRIEPVNNLNLADIVIDLD